MKCQTSIWQTICFFVQWSAWFRHCNCHIFHFFLLFIFTKSSYTFYILWFDFKDWLIELNTFVAEYSISHCLCPLNELKLVCLHTAVISNGINISSWDNFIESIQYGQNECIQCDNKLFYSFIFQWCLLSSFWTTIAIKI